MNDARDSRVFAAVDAVRSFMDAHLAASKIELEAKLIDAYFDHPPFEPAHLHSATQYLMKSGEIERVVEPTRGGRRPPIFVTTKTQSRSRAVTDAASRKRLLMSRYYSYVEGGKGPDASLAGPAGERAFHAALVSANVGTILSSSTRGRPSLDIVMGTNVPVGPLDNGFVLQKIDRNLQRPIGPWGVQVLVEVKNIREWIYPRTQELYQVLIKTALIQRAHPGESFLPLISCRRRHQTTNFMAKSLGFFVVEARKQFLPDDHSAITPDHVLELRRELGLADLVQGTNETDIQRMVNGLRALQTKYDVELALERWKLLAQSDKAIALFRGLGDESTPNRKRDALLADLRELVNDLGLPVSW